MGTVSHIPGRFARSPAGGLSRRGTVFVPVRRALGVTCPTPPMGAYMVQGPTAGPRPSTAPHPLGVCARPSAGVDRMYVSIPTPTNPVWPWAQPGSAHHAVSLIARVPRARNARGRGVTQNQAHLGCHVFCTDWGRQLIDASVANQAALPAILFYYFIIGARCRGRK